MTLTFQPEMPYSSYCVSSGLIKMEEGRAVFKGTRFTGLNPTWNVWDHM